MQHRYLLLSTGTVKLNPKVKNKVNRTELFFSTALKELPMIRKKMFSLNKNGKRHVKSECRRYSKSLTPEEVANIKSRFSAPGTCETYIFLNFLLSSIGETNSYLAHFKDDGKYYLFTLDCGLKLAVYNHVINNNFGNKNNKCNYIHN